MSNMEAAELETRFLDLCSDLNLDKAAKEDAWQSFENISTNYTLEGDELHWLSCSLYVACRKSVLPTVGKGTVEGNCVSLTRLLRSAKLSLINFFNKMKKWADMANLPQHLREKVEHLERNFNVSMVIFKKFRPIFETIFKDPAEDTSKPQRGRKQRAKPCNSTDLFVFAWTLFIYVKGNYPAISDDLVNSYHLLLCCLDLIFSNVLVGDRRDLLNPTFKGLPENFGSRDYKLPTGSVCIIDKLCELYDGLKLEAKGIKEHWWKPYIRKLLEKEVLHGKYENLSGLLAVSCFEQNSKNINREYEEFVLTVGDFDERVFLGDNAEEEIGMASRYSQHQILLSPDDLTERMRMKESLQQEYQKSKTLVPSTPLTGRKYLREKSDACITPVSTATQSVNRLQNLLAGCKPYPSKYLIEMFKKCSQNPEQAMKNRIKLLGEIFSKKYCEPSEDNVSFQMDFAKMRLYLAESLYYKVLENILKIEEKRLGPKFDFTALLNHDIFHKSLFACCMEIVIFSYNSQRSFPWVLDIFEIPAYHFYKVIELMIKAEDGLSRDMVKQLNYIEEQILESLAWQWNSSLWDVLKDSENKVPMCEEVTFLHQTSAGKSPLQHPRVKDLVSSNEDPGIKSPIAAHDRFGSPVAGSAKRRLFTTNNSSRIDNHCDDQSKAIEESEQMFNAPKQEEENVHLKPRRSGSLALFFRKVYHLANVRLLDLCTKLDIKEDLRQKIWTCFEYSLTHHFQLFSDRHLDQFLMCAVYVMSRVMGQIKTFQEIMKCYRMQPQAASHVYRSVLLSKNSGNHSPGGGSPEPIRSTSTLPLSQPGSGPPTPTQLAGTGSIYEDEERGDLIKFYNAIYIKRVQNFVLKFKAGEPPLSPMPPVRAHYMSPRRISARHPVYVSPHKDSRPYSPANRIMYRFQKSPSKNLRDINNMVKSGEITSRKRALLQESDESQVNDVGHENSFSILNKIKVIEADRNVANSHESS